MTDQDVMPLKRLTFRTVTLNCRYCGLIPFSPMDGESNEDALLRHYKAPIHHEYHMHYIGEPCFCGIDGDVMGLLRFEFDYFRRDTLSE